MLSFDDDFAFDKFLTKSINSLILFLNCVYIAFFYFRISLTQLYLQSTFLKDILLDIIKIRYIIKVR